MHSFLISGYQARHSLISLRIFELPQQGRSILYETTAPSGQDQGQGQREIIYCSQGHTASSTVVRTLTAETVLELGGERIITAKTFGVEGK